MRGKLLIVIMLVTVALSAGLIAPRVGADIDEKLSDDQQATEKKTKVAFSRTLAATDELPELVLTGVGARTKLRFKVYGCAHYVAAGTELGDNAATTVINGDFARKIVMHFRRDVDAEKITKAFREGFEKNGFDPTDPAVSDGLDPFLAYFDAKFEKDDRVELTVIPDQGLLTVIRGEAKPIIAGKEFISGLWAIWFGHKPVSKDLREDLLELAVSD